MTTMNVSLPGELKSFVDSQVNSGNYGSTSEYVCKLIRRDQERRSLKSVLLESASSPVANEADTAYFNNLRGRIQDN